MEDLRVASGDGRRRAPAASLVQSGHFRIRFGGIVHSSGESLLPPPRSEERPREDSPQSPSLEGPSRTLAINDDLIVTGNVCLGSAACTFGETFGSHDTLRLKTVSNGIHFDDTSSSPNNDWRVGANDPLPGGADKFWIEDVTGGTVPFTISAGAPTSALHLDSDGDLGLGTATPAREIEVVDGDTPALRLQQDGSASFVAQTWDVAGNEVNFFVEDVTSGELPFRVLAGAQDHSLVIDSDDDIGIGTSAPSEAVHISRPAGANGEIKMVNTSTQSDWAFAMVDSGSPKNVFRISRQGSGGPEFEVRGRNDGDGVATMRVFGSIEATNLVFSSSREVKTAIAPLDGSEVLARLVSLPLAQWRYRTEGDSIRHLGPMAEDFNAVFGLPGDQATISVVDANGIALASIQALHEQLQAKDAQLRALATRLEALEAELRTPAASEPGERRGVQ